VEKNGDKRDSTCHLCRYKPAIKYCALPSGILSSGSPLPARYVLIFAPFELSCIEGDGGTYGQNITMNAH